MQNRSSGKCPKHLREDFFMRNFFVLAAVAFFLTVSTPQTVDASTKTARPSADLLTASQKQKEVKVDRRAEILEAYLHSKNSPMADSAKTFIEEADKYNIDWKWVVSISGNESQFGHMIPPYSYNGWGFGVYGNNVRNFNSWDDGIHVVSEALREDYMDRNGAQNIYQIGNRYASDPRWVNKVIHYMDELSAFEANYGKKEVPLSI